MAIQTYFDECDPHIVKHMEASGFNERGQTMWTTREIMTEQRRLIVGAVKGEGSVNYGIQLLQQQQIYVTQRSTMIIKEYRNYLWKKDRLTDKPLNVPVDAFNHAMDAARYGISDILGGKHYEFRVRTA